MRIQLPEPVQAFFDASGGDYAVQLKQCFSPDAILRDEGRAIAGLEEVAAWLQQAKEKYQHTSEPVSLSQNESVVKVLARVTGNFPGSPVQLEHVFTLVAGKISVLEIH